MASERLNLTVQLERTGDRLQVEYFDVKLRRIGEPVSVAWTEVGAEFAFAHEDATLRGLDGITEALDQGDVTTLLAHFTQDHLVKVGHIFYRALFGNSEQWEAVLRAVFDDHGPVRPNPPRHAVRVRICTTVDSLVDLPWRLSAWKGKFLATSGWTFEVVNELRARADVELETPCPVLVIAPQFADMPSVETDHHLASLREALPAPYLTPSMFRVVETRDQIRDAMRGMSPRVVYYYGHAEIQGGQVCLLLGDDSRGPDAINAADLQVLMGEHRPQVAYVNACKSGAAGWSSVGYQLTPDIPVVIANATTVWSAHAGRFAIRWLTECLVEGCDPVIAAHLIDDAVSTRGFEWGMRTIHTSYGRWRARPLVHLGPITPIGLRLDRDRSRERALGFVSSLVRNDDQRVLCAVSYAEVGNSIDMSWLQLRDHIEDHASHFVQATWRNVRFPLPEPSGRLGARPGNGGPGGGEARPDLRTELFRALLASLEATPREPVEHALRRVARPVEVPGATPLLWLHWGVFGRRHDQLLDLSLLQGWVEFCSELAQRCPPDVRLVCYIALETERAPHPVLEREVTKLALDHVVDPAFACELIPPLSDATELDIAKFLRDRNNCLCPASLTHEAATRIFQVTGGKYEATIELIRRAEREGWHAVIGELRAGDEDAPDYDQPIL